MLYDLEAAGLGFCLYGISCGFPTVDDDMLVGSYSVAGLEEVLAICPNYAKNGVLSTALSNA